MSRSAFFVFCSEHRPTVKGEYPSLTIGDIAKKLAEMWGKQSPKDRTPYEQKAAALRQKYEKVNLHLTRSLQIFLIVSERVTSHLSLTSYKVHVQIITHSLEGVTQLLSGVCIMVFISKYQHHSAVLSNSNKKVM